MVDTGLGVNPYRYAGIADTHTRVCGINTRVTSIHIWTVIGRTAICAGGGGTFDRRWGGEQCLRSKPTGEHETSENDEHDRLEYYEVGPQAFHGIHV